MADLHASKEEEAERPSGATGLRGRCWPQDTPLLPPGCWGSVRGPPPDQQRGPQPRGPGSRRGHCSGQRPQPGPGGGSDPCLCTPSRQAGHACARVRACAHTRTLRRGGAQRAAQKEIRQRGVAGEEANPLTPYIAFPLLDAGFVSG